MDALWYRHNNNKDQDGWANKEANMKREKKLIARLLD